MSVIVVGYGDEPDLTACLAAIRSQLSTGDEMVLVDNGVTALPDLHGARLLTSHSNDGFGAGCHLGAHATRGDVLVFVNSDAVLRPGALAALRGAVTDPRVGLATGLVVMADNPGTVNSAGNPMHYLGISWAGGCGDDVALHQTSRDVASVSGALFAVRREVWSRLGGLDPSYFLYHEDADLSLRSWASGLRVTYVPAAVAEHAYSFAKNPQKMHLLERNRLVTVLTTYPTPLLVRVLPALILTEPLFLLMAAVQGWAGAKLRSWWWLATHTPQIVARRRRLRTCDGGWYSVAKRLEPKIEQNVTDSPPAMGLLNAALAAYWRVAGPRGVHT